MIKKLIIPLVFLFLLLGIVFAEKEVLNLPFLEHECYGRYADKAAIYSFVFDTSKPRGITGVNSKDVIIHNSEEMCNYAASPRRCYECIVKGRYGLNDTTTAPIEPKSNNSVLLLKIVLGIVILVLLIVLIYSFIPKSKPLKSKKITKILDGSTNRRK